MCALNRMCPYSAAPPLEVQAIADGEVAQGIIGYDPVLNGQLTKEEIARAEADPTARLRMVETALPLPKSRGKGARYTPVSKRNDRPDAIAWLLRLVASRSIVFFVPYRVALGVVVLVVLAVT